MAQIRRAEPGDSQALTDLAHAAKGYWGYPQRWMELWRQDLTLTPDYIANNPVYLAEEDGAVTGCYGLAREGSKWLLEHFWIHPAAMGKGLGRRLFEHAREQAREVGAAELEIDADPNAESFYLRMGAVRIGEVRSEIDGQPRVRPILRFETV